MRASERWWVVGAFSVTLLGALVPAWREGAPRLETGEARAATRRSVVMTHGLTMEAPLVPAPDTPAPAPPLRPRPSPSSRTPAAPVDSVSLFVPDRPEPPPHQPLLWDDLFPAPPPPPPGTLAPAARPCFDQLQGIKGISPCSSMSPGAPSP
jgi:hypothetical protein